MNSDPHTERVLPDDGRRESCLVIVAALLILICGGIELSVNQSVPARLPGHLLLDISEKATLTALRNAGDEILFLHNEGEPLPDISSLIDAGIPPFAAQPGQPQAHRWLKVSRYCYLGKPLTDPGQEFLLVLEQGVSVYWRAHSDTVPHTHSLQQTGDCQPDEHWQEFTNA